VYILKRKEDLLDDLNEIKLDYSRFFKEMEEKGISQNKLLSEFDMSNATLYRLRHNMNMTLSSLANAMKIIGANEIGEVVTVVIKDRDQRSVE
jgi:hypothetical protein